MSLRSFFFVVFLLAISVSSRGTHLRAGYIRCEPIDLANRTYRITVIVYTNTLSSVWFGGRSGEEDILDFGDGTWLLVPETPNTPRPDLGSNIGVASFSVNHTFPSTGNYAVSYREPNRNEGILNMDGSVNTRFYIETMLNVGAGWDAFRLLQEPIIRANDKSGITVSLAGYGRNEMKYYYALAVPQSDRYVAVENYRLPDDMSIDPIRGVITWGGKLDGVEAVGELAVAVKIYQVFESEVVGHMVVDFQVITEEVAIDATPVTSDDAPLTNGRVMVGEGETTTVKMQASTSGTDLTLSVNSELIEYPDNFSYLIEDVSNDPITKQVTFSVKNTEAINRDPYYIVSIGATGTESPRKYKKDVNYVIATRDILYDEFSVILSVDEDEFPRLSPYPNPVKGMLRIQNESQKPFHVTIANGTGQVVLSNEYNTDIVGIDFESYPAGPYIITINKGNKTTSYRVIKP